MYSLTVGNDFGSVTSDLSLDVNATRLYHSVPSASNMEMIWVEPGTFIMGQPGFEAGRGSHQVTLSNGFYFGKYEVTHQYSGIMTLGLIFNIPVENWQDVQVFLSRLNYAGRLPNGWKYVFNYACRAGLYSWGNDINSSLANYNYGNETINIMFNSWGFFDMHGNVWEWVNDWFANFSTKKIWFSGSETIN